MVVRSATDENIWRNTDRPYTCIFKIERPAHFLNPIKCIGTFLKAILYSLRKLKSKMFYKGGEKYLFSGYFTRFDFEIYENRGADLNSPLNLC